MDSRQFSWGLLVAALLCLLPALVGVWLVRQEGGAALGWALIGFFGAGVVVLGKKAIGH